MSILFRLLGALVPSMVTAVHCESPRRLWGCPALVRTLDLLTQIDRHHRGHVVYGRELGIYPQLFGGDSLIKPALPDRVAIKQRWVHAVQSLTVTVIASGWGSLSTQAGRVNEKTKDSPMMGRRGPVDS